MAAVSWVWAFGCRQAIVVACGGRIWIRDLRRSRAGRRLALALGAAVAVLAGGTGTAVAGQFAWSSPHNVFPSTSSFAVACPSTTQCTGVDDRGQWWTFNPTSPQADPSTISDGALSAVACPTTTQCTATGPDGGEVTFNPTGGGTIRTEQLGNAGMVAGVPVGDRVHRGRPGWSGGDVRSDVGHAEQHHARGRQRPIPVGGGLPVGHPVHGDGQCW